MHLVDLCLRKPSTEFYGCLHSSDEEGQMTGDGTDDADADTDDIEEATKLVEAALTGASGLLTKHLKSHTSTDVVRLTEIILDRAFLLKQAETADGEEWRG